LVFSSTAAIYGEPETNVISESHPKQPINPYGRSKWMVEQILQDFAKAYGLNSVCLRYFNAAGADPSEAIGEKHNPETHLIPNILKSIASGGSLTLKLFGIDYPTPDGSCVRDYIHVNDLASAHLLAGEYLLAHDAEGSSAGAHAFNLGVGKGFSVLEVIDAASKVTGQKIDYELCERRLGDPAVLVADPSKAIATLGWEPVYTDIEAIIETAWQWHKGGEQFKSYDK
jgi:UDP-glucose 4-epimerase